MQPTFILRFALAIIFGMHSIPAFINGDVVEFGREFLKPLGFGILGIPIAIMIKSIHLISIWTLLKNRFLTLTVVCNAIILLGGIYWVHFKNGWYVVGGGQNGCEFNFMLLAVLIFLWNIENKRVYL